MKRIYLIVLVALCCVALASCQRENVLLADVENYEELSPEFASLMTSLDSLNIQYGNHTDTKSGNFMNWAINESVEGIADAAGAKIGSWLGSRLGAALGVATGNPVVGVVGYVGGGKFGGMAGFVAASYAASLILNGFDGKLIPTYINPVIDSTTTIGVAHNIMISELFGLGKNYFDEDGNVKISEIYDDVLSIELRLNVDDELSKLESYRDSSLLFDGNVLSSAKLSLRFNESDEVYLERVLTNMGDFGVSKPEVLEFKYLSQKLIAGTLNLDDDGLDDYAKDFDQMVDDSSLGDDKKSEIKSVGSVIMYSNAYWK